MCVVGLSPTSMEENHHDRGTVALSLLLGQGKWGGKKFLAQQYPGILEQS
jgi:hypothetical protein